MSDRDSLDPFASPEAGSQPQVPHPLHAPTPPDGYAAPPASPYGAPSGAPNGYGYQNAYGAAFAPAYGAPVPTGSTGKNFLGVLALIFPFVGLSAIGVVMGHMGLAAVKKGTANNRGIAMAGTVISWVVTALSVIGILAAIAVPIFLTQRTEAREAASRSDLTALHSAVATHFVDHTEAPVVEIDGKNYVVGDQITPKSTWVVDVDFVMLGDGDYCLAVTDDMGHELSSTAPGVFAAGACPAPDPQSGADGDAAGDADGGTSDLIAFSGLAVGNCIADPWENVMDDESGISYIEGVTLVDCAEAHYGEVYGLVEIVAESYDENEAYSQAEDLCYFAYEAYMGVAYADSDYFYESYYPTAQGWKLGDRNATCVVTSLHSDTVGSLKGSGL